MYLSHHVSQMRPSRAVPFCKKRNSSASGCRWVSIFFPTGMLAVSGTRREDPPFFGSILRMKVSPGSGCPGHSRTTQRSPSSFSKNQRNRLGCVDCLRLWRRGRGGARTAEDRKNTDEGARHWHGPPVTPGQIKSVPEASVGHYCTRQSSATLKMNRFS